VAVSDTPAPVVDTVATAVGEDTPPAVSTAVVGAVAVVVGDGWEGVAVDVAGVAVALAVVAPLVLNASSSVGGGE
jgi:hypothetical protein